MEVKVYRRKCPYCLCFFNCRKDLRAHVKALHGRDIDDVPPYRIEEEASKRILADYIYRYRPAGRGKCELCGRLGDVYKIGLEDGAVLTRCISCLTGMMERMKRVRFIRVKPHESIRGSKRKVGGLDRY